MADDGSRQADAQHDDPDSSATAGLSRPASSSSSASPVVPVVRKRPARRRMIRGALLGNLLLSLDIPLANAASVLAVRVWPAHDYTRVTLELDQPLQYSYQVIADPHRLVVDLEGGDVDPELRDLVAKIRPDDPYIQQVRVGQYKPKVMRLVFDLKAQVAPQIFALKPVDQYRHRLVLDLFPAAPTDPLQMVLADAYQRGKAAPAGAAAAPSANDPLAALLAGKRATDTPRLPTAGASPVDPPVGGQSSSGSANANAAASSNPSSGPGAGSPSNGPSTGATIGTAIGTGAPISASSGIPIGNGGALASGPGSPRATHPGAKGPAGSTSTVAASGASPAGIETRPIGQTANGVFGGAYDDPDATPTSRRRASKAVVSRLVTIAIDPGHGGEDPGAIGQRGTREKDVVLAVAHQLRDRINDEPNMRAFLTRESDFFVPLSVRVEKARRVQADLFISIHADAFVKPDARGASVFVLSGRGASSTAARWLANKENRSDLIGGVRLARSNSEVARMLLDMSTATQIRDSSNLGRIVLTELGGLGSLHKHDIEQAGFAVLKAPDIPSILVETAFISNPQEEIRLATPRHQASIAEAIFKGVKRYFVKHPPPQRSRST